MKTVKFLLSIFILLVIFDSYEAMSQWSYNGNHIFNSNSGNVGIGNNSPSTPLLVGKNMTEPNIKVQNSGGFGGATFLNINPEAEILR